tara:strand:- start:710 stop:2560 length:1851 start_codon:yes stop_codon:yes gene_type:complete
MAYKFQHGQAILSGAVDQEGSIDIKDDGSGEFELKHDGNTILNSSRALGNVTSISGSTSISGRDLVLDVGGKVGISTDTDLVTLTANKVSVAGVHSASARIDGLGLRIDTGGTIGTAGDNDLLTLNNNSLVVAGAGTFSGGNLAASAGAVSGSTGLAGRGLTIDVGGAIGITTDTDLIALTANNVAIDGALSASQRADARGLRIDTGGVIGTAGDNDLLTLNNASLVVAGEVQPLTVSASARIDGFGLRVDTGGTIGTAGDTDLLTLNNGSLVVAGEVQPLTVSASARIDGFGLRVDTGGTIGTAGDNDLLTLNNGSLVVAGEVQPLTVSASARIDAFGLRIDTGGTIGTAGDTDLLTLANGNLQIAGEVSSSGDADHLAVNAHSFSINNDDFIDASKNITAAGLSGSGNLLVAGTVRLDGVAAAVINEDNDFFYILDADDSLVKKEAVGDVVTQLSGDGLEQSGNKFRLNIHGLAAAVVDVANDSIAIVDANGSNESKKESIADLVDAIAGAGLTATNGVISTQAGAVRVVDDGNTLAEGYNYYTGSAAKSVNLPAAPSVGDVVVVKAGNLGDGNALTVSRQGSHTIDGLTSVALESDYAAASFVYLVNNNWGII